MTGRSLSGYWKGSSNQLITMSGPEPTLAATAALGRTSSQLSWSIVTLTPVASVKAAVLAFHAASSPFTNGTQRSSRSSAPSSGV